MSSLLIKRIWPSTGIMTSTEFIRYAFDRQIIFYDILDRREFFITRIDGTCSDNGRFIPADDFYFKIIGKHVFTGTDKNRLEFQNGYTIVR